MNFSNNTNWSTKICQDCGAWCCKHHFSVIDADDTYNCEYWAARSTKQYVSKLGKNIYVIDQRCPKLDDNDMCTIYEDRPGVCRNYPNRYMEEWALVCKLMQEYGKVRKKGYRLLTRKDN